MIDFNRRRRARRALLFVALFLAALPAARGAEPPAPIVLLSSAPALGADGLPKGWEPLLFKKKRRTRYAWDAAAGAIKAESDGGASGLVYRLDRAAAAAPRLRWRWKIGGVLPKGDARTKAGDDYAARVYVTFRYDPGKASWATRVKYRAAKALYGEYPPHAGLNYIWANALPVGEAVPNAFTDRVMMLAVRSGAAGAGEWVSEERDILADYRRLFGEEPPPLAGVAIMTDADNTGGRATAWYADISLSPRD